MENRIILTKMNDHIWLMDDAGQATGYVVIGSERAAIIDTMIGIANVYEVARSLTSLPLIVINTHGHCDHIFGNVFFDMPCVLHPSDMALAQSHMQFDDFVSHCKEHNLHMPPFQSVQDGDIIDLGGITLQAVLLPGHTPGSICLLDREDRILFTGDAINRHLWMQLDESLSIEALAANLESVLWLKNEADHILHGHARGFESITLMDELLQCAKDLIRNGGLEDEVYHWFGGDDRMHRFVHSDGVICYRANHIYEKKR